VSILLNRTERRQPLSHREIEQITGLRVRTAFRNDYKSVNDATIEGTSIDQAHELGREFAAFGATRPAGKRLETPNTRRGAGSSNFSPSFQDRRNSKPGGNRTS
jgi:hypothetical protein